MPMSESEFLYLSHNVSNLVYHIVCPAKYRRIVFDENVEEHLRQICLEIEKRYDYIKFLEIGTDQDHVHFLVQSTPNYAPTQIVKIIKSITARQIFVECPQVKKNYGEESFGPTDILWQRWEKSKRNGNKRVREKSR